MNLPRRHFAADTQHRTRPQARFDAGFVRTRMLPASGSVTGTMVWSTGARKSIVRSALRFWPATVAAGICEAVSGKAQRDPSGG